jgi:hypothetical protein
MISLIEMEEIAAQIGNAYTESLSAHQRHLHLERVEEAHGIKLAPDERFGVLARAAEHRAARAENRPVAPAPQATILPFRLKKNTA